MTETDIKLLVAAATLTAGGGVAWGMLKSRVSDLSEKFTKCKVEDLMTVEKCKDFHDTRQAATQVQLANIESLLKEMKQERRKFDERLGALASKLDVLDDRWGRAHG